MNQNQMIENLKELSAALWHGEDDTITTLTMWADSLDKAIETLERIRWRKVEEEIPKARRGGYPVDVLTFAVADDGKDKYISDSRYYGGYSNPWCDPRGVHTTHWAYLPEPPEEKE